MISHGESHVSSAVLAETLGLDPVLTRKDLTMAGVPGKPRRGYPSKELAAAINRALGWDNAIDAVLVGAGSLGQALLGFSGFKEHNLSIVVAFDADPKKANRKFHGIEVRPVEDLVRLVSRLKLRIAILTVPNTAAQDCANTLIEAGVVGIMNFTAAQLTVPKDVIVQNVDLAQALAVLSHSILQQ